jgi:hypothetical protein
MCLSSRCLETVLVYLLSSRSLHSNGFTRYTAVFSYCIYDVFRNFVLYGDVGVLRMCLVGANGCVCVVLGENGILQIFDPLVYCWILCKYALSVSMVWCCPAFVVVLLDFLWWTHQSCSRLLFYIGKLLRIGVLFTVLIPGFLFMRSLVCVPLHTITLLHPTYKRTIYYSISFRKMTIIFKRNFINLNRYLNIFKYRNPMYKLVHDKTISNGSIATRSPVTNVDAFYCL